MTTRQICQIEKEADCIVVRFADSVLDSELYQFVSGQGSRSLGDNLCLDLENVRFLSGATLGKLVTLYRELEDRNGHLSIRNVQPHVYEIFQVVKLTAILDIEMLATSPA